MSLSNKKIGIWGLGVVGTAVLNFLRTQKAHLSIVEPHISKEQQLLFAQQNITVYDQLNIQNFFDHNDIIIPSPGIDTAQFNIDTKKLFTELDLFAHHYTKPYIGITGTLGKTTVTTMLSNALTNNGCSIFTGGNIGIGCCDAIQTQGQHDYAVLELSSFQLEHCTAFAPDLAIWTNFYANHIDRHVTEKNYFGAKLRLLLNQHTGQLALVPLSLAAQLSGNTINSTLHFFSATKPSEHQLNDIPKTTLVFWIEDAAIVCLQNNMLKKIFTMPVEHNHFKENILIVVASLFLFQQNTEYALEGTTTFEHRKELVATINDIAFYNDSKATVPEATLAALSALPEKSTILFLGGLSKGVDRVTLIQKLPAHVVHVICFGTEKDSLAQFCADNNIAHSLHKTLEEAFAAAIKIAKPPMQVLFSPAGSSFDLFAHYKERGEKFKKLVRQLG